MFKEPNPVSEIKNIGLNVTWFHLEEIQIREFHK